MSWDSSQFHWHLNTRRFGRQFRYFDEIDSTNKWLLQNSQEFTLSGGVIIAGHQTNGRGRNQRSWSDAPVASLLFSVFLQVRGNQAERGYLSFLPAISLARVLRRHDVELEVALKWPNDLLILHRKAAGVLAEATTGENPDIVVVGMGINLTDFPKHDFSWPATCIHEQSKWKPSREVLLAEILNEWEILFDQFLDRDFAGLRAAWEEFGPSKGARLKRVESNDTIIGEFQGLGEFGQLLIKSDGGELREVFSGDILSA